MSDPKLPPEDVLGLLLETSRAHGASDADARLTVAEGVSVGVLNGQLETIERDESAGVSLRCFHGQRQAHVSGTDLSQEGLKLLAERCASMAKAAPEDAYCGLTPAADLAKDLPALDLSGDADLSPEELEAEALAAEAAALGVDGVRQVPSCSAGWSRSARWLAATNGFSAHRAGGHSGIGLAAVAEADGGMERDYASRSSRRREDRLTPAEIGRLAGERTVARLGSVKLSSRKAPVIYDKRVSASLISTLVNAISGPSIARGVSFLRERLGAAIFSDTVSIIDDPFRARGLGSRPHDGEGRPVRERRIIDRGVLPEWLLNGPSARQLGLQPNGFASTAFGDPPGIATSNLYMVGGTKSPAELMGDVGEGLLVTGMFGPSINPNSGDYSVGVNGFWFEAGEIAYPVSEVTIAGDLPSMYQRLIPANDLEFLGSRDAPSILIEDMTLAGS